MKDKRNRYHQYGAVEHFCKCAAIIPLSWEISGALHLAQLGLTADRQADKIQVNSSFCLDAASLQPSQKPYNFLPIPTIKYYCT